MFTLKALSTSLDCYISVSSLINFVPRSPKSFLLRKVRRTEKSYHLSKKNRAKERVIKIQWCDKKLLHVDDALVPISIPPLGALETTGADEGEDVGGLVGEGVGRGVGSGVGSGVGAISIIVTGALVELEGPFPTSLVGRSSPSDGARTGCGEGTPTSWSAGARVGWGTPTSRSGTPSSCWRSILSDASPCQMFEKRFAFDSFFVLNWVDGEVLAALSSWRKTAVELFPTTYPTPKTANSNICNLTMVE